MFSDKKIILIDLDGVLNSYNGVFDKNFIPEPKQDVVFFLEKLSKFAELYLFTSRKKSHAKKWLKMNNLNKYFKGITNKKISAYLYIDDRAICFKGNYNELLNEIYNFNVYWKKCPSGVNNHCLRKKIK